MDSAAYILAINLAVAGLLAASFAAVAFHDRSRDAALWIAAGYLLGMGYPIGEFLLPHAGQPRLVIVGSFAFLLAAMLLVNAGIAIHYQKPIPWRVLTVLFVVSVAAVFVVQELPRQSFVRLMAYQLPLALAQLLGALLVWTSPRRRELLDTLLLGVLAISAAQFLSKPFLAAMLGGTGASAQTYIHSHYAILSQSIGTVTAIAVALMLLAVLVGRILGDAARRSEVDLFSGLLNRGGFERVAEIAVRTSEATGLPAALIIADIDRFKQINDSFGHGAGDNVIKAFASFIAEAAADRYVAGRIGGEEFAVVLPGCNLLAARLFAENARSAFPGLTIAGLPEQKRVTASFGVAERAAGESLSDLLRRADRALYEAKEAGRDCVRVALAAQPAGSAASAPASMRGNAAPVARRYRNISSAER